MTSDAKAPELLISDLRERLVTGRAVAIVGAGVALGATGGDPLAGWKGLLEDGVKRCEQVVPRLPNGWGDTVRRELDSGDIDDLLSAAQKVEKKLRRIGEFAKWLVDTVGQLQVRDGSVIDALRELQIPILTTNYDGLIEKRAGVSPVTWREPTKYERVIQGDREGVLHLHGFYEDTDSVVLGISSYEALLRDDYAQAMQRAVRALHSLIFIGYGKGLDDPNFSALLEWSRKIFSGSTYRHYRFALAKDVAQIQSEHDPKDRIFVIPYGEKHEDLSLFLRSLVSEKGTRGITPKESAPSSLPEGEGGTPVVGAYDLKDYLAAVRIAHGHIKFVEIPLYEETPDLEIDKLYVEPSVAREQILTDRAESDWPARTDIGAVLAKRQRVVVLGDPGYGKSTLTSCLSWRLCNFRHDIPIPMIVRELHLKADLNWERLLDAFLQHRIGKLLGNRDTLEALLRDGRAVIFLDGLDEIGNLMIRRRLRDAVHDGMSQYQSVKWVLTSRVVGYDQVPFHVANGHATANGREDISREDLKTNSVASVVYLAPFTGSQIREFATKWYERHESDPNLAPERAEAFVKAINDNAGTKRLARVPYLLTLMALIHRKAASLPHGRTDLYDRISAAYLESIDVKRELAQVPYSLAQKKRWLAEVGYQMQLRRTKKRTGSLAEQADILATQDEVCEWLSKAMGESGAERPTEEANTILDYFARRSGLLVPRGEGVFAFMHLSLQEYFTACYLEPRLTASRFARSQRTVPTDKQLHGWANQNEWLEVYILLFELLAKKDAADTEEFFTFLFVDRFNFDTPGSQMIAARLLAELVVDPFVNLTASTRRWGRKMCWTGVFSNAFKVGAGRRNIFGVSTIAQLLLSESSGELRQAWQAADFTSKEVRDSAICLDLSGCTGITDIEPLAALTQLTELSLAGCTKLVEFSPLAKLVKLVTLNLDHCSGLTDLSPLSRMKQLRSLNVSGCLKVTNFSALAALKKITRLTLPQCSTFDSLLPIASMTNLTGLSIDHLMAPVNFAYLLKCPKLNDLMVDGASTTQDLSPLAQHRGLRSIHLHNFPPDIDLTPFASSATLKRLCLAGTAPKDIPPELERSEILVNHRGSTKRAARRPRNRAASVKE